MERGLGTGPRGTGTLDVKIGELADGRDGGRIARAGKEARQEWDANMRAVSRQQNLWVGWLGYALYSAPFDDLEVEVKDLT